jgi:peptidoglycan/LPS O-acetylase OafA/YrhL
MLAFYGCSCHRSQIGQRTVVMAGRREATRPAIENVAGLDTIRFLAALCVVLGHGASFPLAAYIPEKVGMWRVLVGLNSSLFNGVAAVLVFFAVSGFCIHYRFAAGAVFQAAPFLCRRLLRIGIPFAGASAVVHLVGPGATAALDAVIWTFYPTLRIGFQQFGILACTLVSLGISVALILLNWDLAYY